MPIRPIDIVKSQEVSQYKQLQSNKLQHEQAQLSKSFQNMVRSEAQKPVETTKSEYNEFRYDAKEESRNKYSGMGGRRKQKENKKEDKRPDNKNDRPGGINILI